MRALRGNRIIAGYRRGKRARWRRARGVIAAPALVIPVGEFPYGVAVDPTAHIAYVTNSSNTVSVIDEATNTVAATVSVGDFPYGVAVDPATHTAYVANSDSGAVSTIQMCR